MTELDVVVHASSGYTRAIKRLGIEDINLFAPGKKAFSLLLRDTEPSWIVGDPKIRGNHCLKDDGGRTLRITSRFKFYAIRDKHPEQCDCGCGGGTVITFLLADEY